MVHKGGGFLFLSLGIKVAHCPSPPPAVIKCPFTLPSPSSLPRRCPLTIICSKLGPIPPATLLPNLGEEGGRDCLPPFNSPRIEFWLWRRKKGRKFMNPAGIRRKIAQVCIHLLQRQEMNSVKLPVSQPCGGSLLAERSRALKKVLLTNTS